MSYRKLLVPLSGAGRDDQVLTAAFDIAKPFGAHVMGVYVRPDPSEVLPYLGEGVSAGVIQEIMEAARSSASKAGAAARSALDHHAKAQGVPTLENASGGTGFSASFCLRDGPADVVIPEEARLSDLVIFGLSRDAKYAGHRETIESTLLNGRSPILLVPDQAKVAISAKVAIGWDGGATAARAVAAAIPMLKRASSIEILNISPGTTETMEMDRLRDYLRLYGLSATEHGIQPGGQSTGAVLLDAAVRAGAGMLVIGGYGHSRLRELVLGGVTRHVLAESTIPIFMAH